MTTGFEHDIFHNNLKDTSMDKSILTYKYSRLLPTYESIIDLLVGITSLPTFGGDNLTYKNFKKIIPGGDTF